MFLLVVQVPLSREERDIQHQECRSKLQKMWAVLDKGPLLAKLQADGMDITMEDLLFFSAQNVALLCCATRHNCSQAATAEYADIAKEFVKHGHGVKSVAAAGIQTLPEFERHFSKFRIPLTKYNLCDCGEHIFDANVCDHRGACGTLKCPHAGCGKLETELTKKWVWHEFSLVDILRDLFEDPVTSAMMQAWYHFLTTVDREEGMVRTTWESARFQEKMEQYPKYFGESRNVTILMIADAYTVVKDGSKTCFPILFQVLNFPPHLRSKYKYLQWFGFCDGKPKARVLYDRFVDQLLPLWTTGARMWDFQSSSFFTCRVMLYGILMDLKGLLEAMEKMDVQSYRACPCCDIWGTNCWCIKTMTYRAGKHEATEGTLPIAWHRKLVERIFKRNEEDIATLMAERPNLTRASALKHATIKDTFHAVGWKAEAVFVRLPYFDIAEDGRLDIMHTFQNVGRRVHATLDGHDMTEQMRQQARVLKEHKNWWPSNDNSISPFTVPRE